MAESSPETPTAPQPKPTPAERLKQLRTDIMAALYEHDEILDELRAELAEAVDAAACAEHKAADKIAEELGPLRDENAELRARVERLEEFCRAAGLTTYHIDFVCDSSDAPLYALRAAGGC